MKPMPSFDLVIILRYIYEFRKGKTMLENTANVLFWDAENYSANSKLQYNVSFSFFNHYPFRGNETVLDIGCGDGRIANFIADQLPLGHVTAIDNSPTMIELAQQKVKKTNVKFSLMDAQRISLPHKFDIIISTFCFHWILDKLSALRIIRNHLKADGKLLFIIPLQNKTTAQIRNDLIRGEKWRHYYTNYVDPSARVQDANYAQYAEQAGFNSVVLKHEKALTEFDTAKDLLNFLKNLTPCLEQLPTDDLKNEFMQDLVNAYLEFCPPSPDNKSIFQY
jgi:trans-aconitate 2-methyltransferase